MIKSRDHADANAKVVAVPALPPIIPILQKLSSRQCKPTNAGNFGSVYNANAPSATRPSNPAKVEVLAAPPSDSCTSCASPVGAEVEPRVEEEVVMLAVLLPEWWVADEAAVAEVIMLESVMLMLMLMDESVSLLDIMELAVEAMDEAMDDELGVLLSDSMTKGGV